jgi:CheY-like chemotaxis protein
MARILFVDDDPDTLETFSAAVKVLGHQAILAKNGQEGFYVAVEQSPDLIFIDMSLTDMNGLELIKDLGEQDITRHIPTLMLSATPEADVSENAIAAGAKAYLSKPVRLQSLLEIIQKYANHT